MTDFIVWLLHPRTLPTIMIVLDVFAGIGYFFLGDQWRSVYWLSAAVLTTSVTYGMK